jgi:hypothetical protein
MLLGLTYHAAYAYLPGVGPWYFVADPAAHEGFRVLAGVLHAVRMPAFFALAGYFAHLGLTRRAPAAFAADRARRLLVPFAVALPLTWAADVAVRRWSLASGLMDPAYPPGAAVRWVPLHLWFLELLFVLCLAGAALARAWPVARWPARLAAPWAVAAVSGVGGAALAAAHGELRPDLSLWPDPASLAVYGGFFAFGLALGAAPGSLPAPARWLWPLGLALALFVHTRHLQWEPAGLALDVAAAWLVTLGALAAALALGEGELAWARPLVEAAYWVYLVHYPLVGALQVALAPAPLAGLAKYLLVVAGALAASFASYRWLVRGTRVAPWVGGR